jgi:hypothetical protein
LEMDVPCQVVARLDLVCRCSRTSLQPVCRCWEKRRRAQTLMQTSSRLCEGARLIRIGSPIEPQQCRWRHRCREITVMSMLATATLGIMEITAVITTITAAFNAAARADRAVSEGPQTHPATACRVRRRVPRAHRASRQTIRVRPEYLPALARSRILRLRGMR